VIAGAAIASSRSSANQQQDYEEAPPVEETQAAPPPADPADQFEQLAQLQASGALTDEEFAEAKAKVLAI
jgi:Short C-terminal domain